MRIISTLLFVAIFGLFGSSSLSAQNKTVGAEKCKMCHKVQYESWAASKHATLAEKGAQCETCHGPGSAYMAISVMKDPVKAKAAGLIAKPEKAGCVGCHKKDVADDALPKVHAHKAKATK
jgi:hypothetical protein